MFNIRYKVTAVWTVDSLYGQRAQQVELLFTGEDEDPYIARALVNLTGEHIGKLSLGQEVIIEVRPVEPKGEGERDGSDS